ncbi:polysaccharide export protein [Vibrio maritimus]|uniref:polysaccharide export protein n=1 Tax=Vibrio maritimus TaxID=990268 RepID=UPI001F37CDBC|nr:polysaccharide export protein [Vibrio maritimus]
MNKNNIAGMLALLFLAGCSLPGSHLPTSDKTTEESQDTNLEQQVSIYPLTAEKVVQFKQQIPQATANPALDLAIAKYEYRVGVGDVLNITIWDHPELTIPAGSYRSSEEAGNWVHADGTIFYPYIGKVHVVGKSVTEIRVDIAKRLSKFIESPQVDVNIAAFRSQKTYVTGEVQNPGQQPITNIPLTLLDAINRAGGLADDADWRNVTLTRNGEEQTLSLYALMQRGDLTQNLLLKPGDIVHVPRNDDQKVFVLGEVSTPQMLKIDRAGMSLTEALSSVGGINEVAADASGVFVIRNSTKADQVADIYQLNIKDATALVIGTEFSLQPYDVVYVTAQPISRWNRLMTQLLPTLTGIKNIADAGNSYRAWGN